LPTNPGVCSVCGQTIAEDFRLEHIAELEAAQAEVKGQLDDVVSRIQRAAEREQALETALEAARGKLILAEASAREALVQRQAKQRESDDLQRQAIRCRNEKNPYDDQLNQATAQKRQIEAELAAKQTEEAALVSHVAGFNYWRGGFRRVRLFCLENVLAELAVETRNSLMALGLLDWRIGFKTATETRSGTLKLGVQVDVQPPRRAAARLDVLSGGEGQRARLAGSLGLANLVQRWAGVRWNCEIWDEPTAFLSDQGIDDLLDCLAERARITGRAIYVCDHRALQSGVFDQVLTVVKDAGGSRLELA
jgi:DNA repair exonuclease SbcCD ATPase subunit